MTEVRITRFGGPEVFRAVETPSPVLPPGHVRIRVSAAGINFADIQMRMGLYPEAPKLPFAPGFEVAGVISEVSPDVSGFRAGERVLAPTRFGGYATEVVLPATLVRRTPRKLSDVEAASIPVCFMTAWIALMELARVREDDRVLVPGASGGVGGAMIQVAARAGAQVTGQRRSIARTLLQLLQTPVLTSIGLQMSNRGLFGLNMLTLFKTEKGLQLALRALDSSLQGFQDGVFKPTVGRVFPLAEAGLAHAHLQSKTSTGKVVLRCF